MKTRNSEVLTDFIAYCLTHQNERFWQALRNWAEVSSVYVEYHEGEFDTFNWEGRRG